jgi:putative PIN family toxin of toxin-antitoxin system
VKVVFDTNVCVAEALLGTAAARMIDATHSAGWRVYVTSYLLDELERVLADNLGFSRRLAVLSRQRIVRRCASIELPTSRHAVPDDPKDSPILQTALAAGADYLVTNDRHLLSLDPYEGVRIISMNAYERLLIDQGLLSPGT